MDDYIERGTAIQRIREVVSDIGFKNPGEAVDTCIAAIETVSAADVAPVRHGRWNRPYISWFFPIKIKNPNCFCTNCAYPVKPKRKTRYCPNCGSKMDLNT